MSDRPNPRVHLREIATVYVDPNNGRYYSAKTKSPRVKYTIKYQVRWKVGPRTKSAIFPTKAGARNLHDRLRKAMNLDEPFDLVTREPASWATSTLTFADLARDFMLANWDSWEGHSRRSNAEALSRAVPGFVHPKATVAPQGMRAHVMHHVLMPEPPVNSAPADPECVTWLNKYLVPVDQITEQLGRQVLTTLGLRDDGKLAAHNTTNRYRITVNACFTHGIEERNALASNPWPQPKKGRRRHKAVEQRVDPIVTMKLVPSPDEANELLLAMRNPKAQSLVTYAFFGTIYACGLRPFEVAGLRDHELLLPDEGFGEARVHGGIPGVATKWLTSPEDVRTGPKGQAKQAQERVVPVPDWWVRELRGVFDRFPAKNGLLFTTANGTTPTASNLWRAFDLAKRRAFPTLIPMRPGSRQTMPNPLLDMTPYYLRHARATEWLKTPNLNPALIARWMGHSLDVLLSRYAGVTRDDVNDGRNLILPVDWRGISEDAQYVRSISDEGEVNDTRLIA